MLQYVSTVFFAMCYVVINYNKFMSQRSQFDWIKLFWLKQKIWGIFSEGATFLILKMLFRPVFMIRSIKMWLKVTLY